jgi:histidyl-tRNA synthetase
MRGAAEQYGYREFDGPFLESLELYAAKSSDELVKEQSFAFQDRGGDWITLRPELTPSLARMVAQKQRELSYPLRWWSFGPMWRYENTQKGRSREFFQWNVDLVGTRTPAADAELAAVAVGFLRMTGLSPADVQILVNDRRLVDSELAKLDIAPERRSEVSKLIDRRDKRKPAVWEAEAAGIGLNPAQIEGVYKLLADAKAWERSPELREFFAAAEALGAAEYLRYAPHIVRGLDYYTGTVFEAWDCQGEFRAILGGGHYDNLVAAVGGEPVGGVGFAMGDVVIGLVLAKFQRLPTAAELVPASALVTLFHQDLLVPTWQVASELRAAGIPVASYPHPDKLDKQFKYAERIGAVAAVVLGPDELAQGTAVVKDLRKREQRQVPRAEIAAAVRLCLHPQI